jgi:hypothetical protein
MNLDYYYGIDHDKKKTEFHHVKIVRKRDEELKKKRLKIEWMQKMYKNGMLQTKDFDANTTNELVEEATRQFFASLDNASVETYNAVDDWEVDELLEWTNGLNYDEYRTNWNSLGTTAFSNKQINKQQSKNDRSSSGRLSQNNWQRESLNDGVKSILNTTTAATTATAMERGQYSISKSSSIINHRSAKLYSSTNK